jgi:DNA-binding FadR family transcriptional regulator
MALLDEHKRIYEAVSQRDSQKARELMREHLLRTETWFRKGFQGGSGMEERDEKGRTLQ